MKKILGWMLLSVFTLGFFPQEILASDKEYFIVTAYYSPLPDQEYYITGSYETEKRLNGEGIAGASGKKVFSGMLAAPSKYRFGTKIELEGLGIGSVEDRGGAIVQAGKRGYEHDRIDVWVGYGDEGLRRAMYWGKRKIPGKIIYPSSDTSLDYTTIPAPSWAVPKTTTLYGKTVQVHQGMKKTEIQSKDIFSVSLGKGSDSGYITQLQKILSELGYYTAEISSGVYDTHTIDAVYNFQINHDIVTGVYTPGAGSYGPQTRKKLAEIYALYGEEKKREEELRIHIAHLKEEAKLMAQNTVNSLSGVQYGDISSQVRVLQKTLSEIGYFEHKDTAIFGVKTRNALIDFQIDQDVISSQNSQGSGVFGPQTQNAIERVLTEIYLRDILELEGLSDEYDMIFFSKKVGKTDISQENIIPQTI